MMEKLERLGRRLRLRPEEAGEGVAAAKKGLRWHHKAFLGLAFAVAIFGAASLAGLNEAQAHHYGEWGSDNCYYTWDDYYDYWLMRGCATQFYNVWFYQTVVWNGQQYVYTGDVYVSSDGGYTWQTWLEWATSTNQQNEAVWSAMGPIAERIGNIGGAWTKP